jgi:hypothetical protein
MLRAHAARHDDPVLFVPAALITLALSAIEEALSDGSRGAGVDHDLRAPRHGNAFSNPIAAPPRSSWSPSLRFYTPLFMGDHGPHRPHPHDRAL